MFSSFSEIAFVGHWNFSNCYLEFSMVPMISRNSNVFNKHSIQSRTYFYEQFEYFRDFIWLLHNVLFLQRFAIFNAIYDFLIWTNLVRCRYIAECVKIWLVGSLAFFAQNPSLASGNTCNSVPNSIGSQIEHYWLISREFFCRKI